MQLNAGRSAPPGAWFDGAGVNFTLFSAHAEKVELCVFDESGNEARYTLPARSGDIWHGYLPDARPGLRYGYRVYGPWRPEQGHRFNPAKLLLDPCARGVEGDVVDDPRLYGGIDAPDPRDNRDVMPKAVVMDDRYDWEDDAPPAIAWGDTVIYEAHVRGLTRLHPTIPSALRALTPRSATRQ